MMMMMMMIMMMKIIVIVVVIIIIIIVMKKPRLPQGMMFISYGKLSYIFLPKWTIVR